MEKIKVYFGCSLTHAPEDFKNEIEQFKEKLRKELGVEVFDFLGLIAGTSEDVYNYDIHRNVEICDIFIGDCTYPSIGLGWELGTAVEKRNIPVLAIAHSSAKVTRLVKGAECSKNPLYRFITYEHIDEILNQVYMIVQWLRRR
jgi:hypothetical protein